MEISADTDLAAAWDLVAMRTATSVARLTALVAAHYHLNVADLEGSDPHAHKLLTSSIARNRNVLPLRYTDRDLVVATADPVGMTVEHEIHRVTARAARFAVADPRLLAEAVRRVYPEGGKLRHEVEPLPAADKGGPHVLVVDDDESTRVMIRALLEGAGFRVSEAVDGTDALEMLAGPESFALVTLDLQMGKMHGMEVLQRIRSRLGTATLPVVVATGSDDPATEMQLFEAGADDFVVKPFDPPRFLLRVQAVLRRRSPNPLSALF